MGGVQESMAGRVAALSPTSLSQAEICDGEMELFTIDSLKFFRFITAVVARCGQMLNVADITGDADINQIQAKNWLGILETLGIIFYLHPYSNSLLKRFVKTPKLYFYDTSLLSNKVEQCRNLGEWCDEWCYLGKLCGCRDYEDLHKLWQGAISVLLS